MSDEAVSDVPVYDWDVPASLANVHVYRIATMWLDFARQSMRLKFIVADIVQSNLRKRCNNCRSRFRLQVIQKIDFNALTKKFRLENIGLVFTKARWRRFYRRRQIFVTLCMECAYSDNLAAGDLRQKDQGLQALMA